MDVLNTIKTFLKSEEKFRLIQCYGHRELISPTTRRLLILDSSFNPPHIGHLSMIKQSVQELNRQSSQGVGVATINTNSLLLLFSVKNADKGSVSVEEYSRRLHMVDLMSTYISTELGLACGVALSDASLFVDKSALITNWIEEQQKEKGGKQQKIGRFFLLGFDTLIRFFNPKYYSGSMIDALDPFFQQSRLCVLLRNDTSSGMDVTEQEKFLQDIEKGEISNGGVTMKLPASWRDKVTYCEARNEWAISSSGIRRAIAESSNAQEWESKVIPSIGEYIKDNSFYRRESLSSPPRKK